MRASLYAFKEVRHRKEGRRHEGLNENQYLVQGLGVRLPKFGPRLWAKLGCFPSLPTGLRTEGTSSSGTFLGVKEGAQKENEIC